MRNLGRNLFMVLFLAGVMSIAGTFVAYALQSITSTYPDGYTMTCTLDTVEILGSTGAMGVTSTDDDAVAFVGVFSYKNSEYANYDSAQQDFYAYVEVLGKGGNVFKSTRALKETTGRPHGAATHLEEKAK